jgi:hypothetical protein
LSLFFLFIFLVQGSVSHVKYSPDRSFIGGHWVLEIFSPDPPGFFFQIRLSSTRTDAAAHTTAVFTFAHSAASILNSLGAHSVIIVKSIGDEMTVSVVLDTLLIALGAWLIGGTVGVALGILIARRVQTLFTATPHLRRLAILLPWRTTVLSLVIVT